MPVDSKNFAIGVLSTTAVVLLVGLVLMNNRPEPALASGMTQMSGDYVVTVGSVSHNDEELVYVLDASLGKMIIYRFDAGTSKMAVVEGIDLGEMRRSATASGGPTTPANKKKP